MTDKIFWVEVPKLESRRMLTFISNNGDIKRVWKVSKKSRLLTIDEENTVTIRDDQGVPHHVSVISLMEELFDFSNLTRKGQQMVFNKMLNVEKRKQRYLSFRKGSKK